MLIPEPMLTTVPEETPLPMPTREPPWKPFRRLVRLARLRRLPMLTRFPTLSSLPRE
jgi:hypothetical protein